MYWNSITNGDVRGTCRLIETWDVLKSRVGKEFKWFPAWLIETWDVLKLRN